MLLVEEQSAGLSVTLVEEQSTGSLQFFLSKKNERWDAFTSILVEVGVEFLVNLVWV